MWWKFCAVVAGAGWPVGMELVAVVSDFGVEGWIGNHEWGGEAEVAGDEV